MTLLSRRMLLRAALGAAVAGIPACAPEGSGGELRRLWPEASDIDALRTFARRIAAQHPAIAERARSLVSPGTVVPSPEELVRQARFDAAAGELVQTDGWYLPSVVAVIVVATWGS